MTEAPPRLAADRMLQRLARWLRLLGADVTCDPELGGAEALHRARLEGRPFLTRDKRLRTAPDVLYLQAQLFRDQLREVLAHHPFDPQRFAFSRCSRCNTLLHEVPRDVVGRRVPPFVYATHDRFALCEHCHRIYWDATHLSRARAEFAALIPAQSVS
ncbi:MAG TPA: Mut7-C RNAse domain-containing protein [Candidatus Binataceae bacterium]|nr:Mut7-C RNAse domain-containing protein [Candidatus Binataceae bacterium]